MASSRKRSAWIRLVTPLSFVSIILIGLVLATQITAYQLAFAEQLGAPFKLPAPYAAIVIGGSIFSFLLALGFAVQPRGRTVAFVLFLLGLVGSLAAITPWYSPFSWLQWYSRFQHIAALSSLWSLGIGLLVGSVCLALGSVVLLLHYFREENTKDTYGSAHWASLSEIKQSQLLNNHDDMSVYVGAWQHPQTRTQHYLRYSGDAHVFVFAPSRSGKGVGLVIPTLLSYQGSVIINDIKKENWQLTAGWRQSMGQRVLLFDPSDTQGLSAHYNPFNEVRKGAHEIRDLQNIADIISDPDGVGRSDHWSESANSLFVTVALHILYAEKDKTLAGVRNFLSQPEFSARELFERMMETQHAPSPDWVNEHGEPSRTHPIVAHGAGEMLKKCDEELSSILSTVSRFLKLFRDPIVAANTRNSDFSIADIVGDTQPCSLYLATPPSDLVRLRPLIRIVLQQIVSRLTESMDFTEQQKSGHKLLLLLDEFPQLGKFSFFEESVGYLAGYGIQAYFITQDLNQLYKTYGPRQSISANCAVRITYAANTLETAEHISKMLGSSTRVDDKTHYSGGRYNLFLRSISLSQHETSRPLLTSDEIMRLGQNQSIISQSGSAPIAGTKIIYYSDPTFASRAKLKAPTTSDKVPCNSPWTHIASPSKTFADKQNPAHSPTIDSNADDDLI